MTILSMRNAECGMRNVQYSPRRTPHSTCHGFSTMEYAVLTAIIVVAFLSMSAYLSRSLCGRWREVGDVFGYGRQYEPGNTHIQVE